MLDLTSVQNPLSPEDEAIIASKLMTHDYDPNEARDKNGRWTASGEVDAFPMLPGIRARINKVADKMGFPGSRIYVSKGEEFFTLNGQSHAVAALAINSPTYQVPLSWKEQSENYVRGDIVLFSKAMEAEGDGAEGVIAHEIEHQRFQPLINQAREEAAYVTKIHGDDIVGNDGTLNPAYEKEMPVAFRLQEGGFYGPEGETLANTDGCSDYSTQYWNKFDGEPSRQNFELAVHETLAEMARLQEMGADISKSPPLWKKLFGIVDGEYRKMHVKDYDEDEPRDDHGRWTRSGEANNLGSKAKEIRKKMDEVADLLNYPKNKIFMSNVDYKFELNGEIHRAAGVAYTRGEGDLRDPDGNTEHYDIGDIVIFGGKDGHKFNDDFDVKPIVAHEIEHQKFQWVLNHMRQELAATRKDPKQPWNHDTHSVRPEYEDKYPVLSAMGKTEYGKWMVDPTDEDKNVLMHQDGVTEYSREWWDEYQNKHFDGKYYDKAVHETLAEIATLKEEGKVYWTSPTIYHDMTEFIDNDLARQYREDGSKFATANEFASMKGDPWAYFEMVDRDKFKKSFGVFPEKVRPDHGRQAINVDRRDMWNPLPLVSPEWEDLFNTVEKLYSKKLTA